VEASSYTLPQNALHKGWAPGPGWGLPSTGLGVEAEYGFMLPPFAQYAPADEHRFGTERITEVDDQDWAPAPLQDQQYSITPHLTSEVQNMDDELQRLFSVGPDPSSLPTHDENVTSAQSHHLAVVPSAPDTRPAVLTAAVPSFTADSSLSKHRRDSVVPNKSAKRKRRSTPTSPGHTQQTSAPQLQVGLTPCSLLCII
jgi:hypothetical protein